MIKDVFLTKTGLENVKTPSFSEAFNSNYVAREDNFAVFKYLKNQVFLKKSSNLDFKGAVKFMVDARSYLANLGFWNYSDDDYSDDGFYSKYQKLQDNSKIVFSDKSILFPAAFDNSSDIEGVLQKIIIDDGKFIVPGFEYIYNKNKLLVTSMKKGPFEVYFTVQDTSKKGKFFLAKPFYRNSTEFTLESQIHLDEEVINEKDISKFNEIEKGLRNILYK